jgi:GntR family transcriptional regulator
MAKLSRTNISDEVAEWLVNAIKTGRFKQGEKLPSVEQLAEELGVGRSSVREAWQHLQALGMIQVTHGKGTYVSIPKLQLDSQIIGFTQSIRERGMRPGSVVLERRVVPAPEGVAALLKLEAGERVNLLHRLRLADDIPMAIQTSYTPYDLFPELLEGPWSLDTSLYGLLASRYGVELGYAQHTIRVSLIDPAQGQLLQVPANSPALELDTVAFTAEGTPIEVGHDIYRGDRYQYTVMLAKRP